MKFLKSLACNPMCKMRLCYSIVLNFCAKLGKRELQGIKSFVRKKVQSRKVESRKSKSKVATVEDNSIVEAQYFAPA